ncbi:bacteriophage CI repressor [Salmonella enterica]|uniref:Bacteriophage CI repressor n=2 Tax=Salmonella enterica TaxID=28901 RepID=A0A760NAA1_SALER|nr:hypothetical protein [Salmonella enterica]EBF9678812.1 bacteriophage CI repressor [Salmonella enterica subsp. enterica serovar Glostrup]EBS4873428.1 hypothetical protein [Salmonella enterica subsp. enterica serovar Hvittingfoss]EBX3196819.1 hypothetical protein [Salmonella enterica subsp. enterica serovar Abony]EBY7514933.1 hypothetical protein [Salmonella enterica subsp. enterica serovar Richmond]ECC1626674.1 bacteriophage CI repressor [Salmonella enterica subsp. salamae]EDQ9667620.1 bact
MRKERQGTFANDAKVPVIDRIAQLVRRYPSRSAAARAWGINVNTLNSYYKNDVPTPTPRENLLAKIAESEGVSLEWLATGDGESPESQKTPINRDRLSEILDFLTEEERQRLAITLARKGVETILYLLDEDSINLLEQHRNRAPQVTPQARSQPEHKYTNEELEAMIMALPVRESLKTAFARGVAAGEAADREILRILESHERGVSPGSVPDATKTPDPSLKQNAG